MRVGYTICFNSDHHFSSEKFKMISDNFDHFVFVEGAVQPTHCTNWCKTIPAQYIKDGCHSADNTLEMILEAEQNHENISVITQNKLWDGKVEMCNAALKRLRDRHIYNIKLHDMFLWEWDSDEVWTAKQLDAAEMELVEKKGDTGMFLCEYFVGPDIVAVGEWGRGELLPYRRLHRWCGQLYSKHEPPTLEGGNGKEILLSQRFVHNAWMYRKDVIFKSDFYSSHEGALQKWDQLQKCTDFPQPITALIGGYWGTTKTQLHRLTKKS